MKAPWWMTILIAVAALVPLCAFPWLLSGIAEGAPERTLLWLFPVYAIATAVCAWICYYDRPYLSWILVVMLLLSDAGMFYLCLR